MKAKRERLEAWKRKREASKALDEAKARSKAMALAGKAPPAGEFTPLSFCYWHDFTPLDL